MVLKRIGWDSVENMHYISMIRIDNTPTRRAEGEKEDFRKLTYIKMFIHTWKILIGILVARPKQGIYEKLIWRDERISLKWLIWTIVGHNRGIEL